ncbi:MAG: hypothetical protein IKJ50_06190 [Clostridia bacterium]|nr:hypothetical protein [Clostridia bacterium]
MGKIFGDVKGKEQLTPREAILNRYDNSRANLLFAIVFTAVNMILVFCDSSSYFLFSLFVPYFLTYMGMFITGTLPAEVYAEEFATMEFLPPKALAIMLVAAVVILILYILSWIFSKKQRVGWLIFALVMFAIDTVLMLVLQGIAADSIIDLAFHGWVIFDLSRGIYAYSQLKRLPQEEVAEADEEAVYETDEEIACENSPVLRMADMDTKAKILLETEKDGFVITYRRVKRVNELVINGSVYDEYEALIENAHVLVGVVGGRTIEAGFDGFRSFIKIDGEIIAKKVRLA